MTEPVISVCVITYNQRNLIETCLRSILDQKVDANVQVLVGDDASTDGTSEVISALEKEYGARLQHYRHDPNIGALANMCDLIARANGDFIARVDGDDYWLPGKLERQLAYLQRQPDCAAVFTNAITTDESGNQLGLFNDVGDVRFDISDLLRRGNILNNSSILFRKENKSAWDAEAEDLIDYQLHFQLAKNGWLGHIGEPLTAYRVNAQGSMVASANDHVRELYWQAIQRVPRKLVSDDDYAHGIADFLRRVFFRSIRMRDPLLFRTWAKRVYAASPYGATHTTALVATAILRMGGKMWAAWLPLFSGRRQNILYRH